MNKRDFLEELKSFLSILEEKEQKDILDEYSQHIEMKIKTGMSEEEAIKDFGDIRELASDIMEAYHVKLPQGDRTKGKKRARFAVEEKESLQEKDEIFSEDLLEDVRKETGNFLLKVKEQLRKAGKCVKGGFIWTGEKLKSLFCTCRDHILRWIKKPVQWEKKLREAKKNSYGKKENQDAKEGSFMMGVVRFIRVLLSGAYHAWMWCIRTCVNLLWICLAVFFGMLSLCALFGLGMMTVLLCAGYPLIGATILCLGGLLVCGSITVLCFCSTRRSTKGEVQNA